MSSDPAIDRGYDPALTIADAAARIAALAVASAEVVARGGAALGQAYGAHPDEYLDLYPAKASRGAAPVHMFVHGGFWRAFSARDYAFVAGRLQAAGSLVAVVNYSLCPAVTIPAIVEQSRAALAWLYANAARFGGDPHCITVSGHSAGGHIAAMLGATDWRACGLPGDAIKAICGVSGLYDLEPLSRSWLQPLLSITPEIVDRCSPVRLPADHVPPAMIAWGGEETAAFRGQSVDYCAHLRAAGRPATALAVSGRDHIGILHEFIEGGPLFDAIDALIHNLEPSN